VLAGDTTAADAERMASSQLTVSSSAMLKILLREKHWQNYSTFTAEYGVSLAPCRGAHPQKGQR
jgi:hypothetical protein